MMKSKTRVLGGDVFFRMFPLFIYIEMFWNGR